MRSDGTPQWFVSYGQLSDSARSFGGRVVINPRQLSGAARTLDSVAGEFDLTLPPPPKLPPSGAGVAGSITQIGDGLRDIAHELRAMATMLTQRAQFANKGEALDGTAPTLDLQTLDSRMEDIQEIRDDMDKRHLSQRDRELINSLIDAGMWHSQYKELLHGGHVLIEGTELYERWQKLDGVYDRTLTNSHYKKKPHLPMYGRQFGFDSNDLGGVLFGKGPKGSTFIQLEAHGMPVHNIVDLDVKFNPLVPVEIDIDVNEAAEVGQHVFVDYDAYKDDPLHQNRGPHGTSPHNDKDPIVIGKVNLRKGSR